MFVLYLHSSDANHTHDIEQFCCLYGTDFVWLSPQYAKFYLNQQERPQLAILYDAFQNDIACTITTVIGFDHDVIMQAALDIAVNLRSGRMIDMGDVLLLSTINKDFQLLNQCKELINQIPNDILKTAQMYLLTQGNAQEAAKLLYLHRNSFTYRLNKFIQLSRIDIKESALTYFLHIYFTLQQSDNY
ncbi:MAG: helix-turn-helix domain-containing protein [Erysipelotrichaceae bacterium]